MSSKIEENLKIVSEYLKGLDTISYDKIVDTLKDENDYYQVDFYDSYDVLNDIHYSCVSITKNHNTSTMKEYLSIDQDVRDVYTNLIATLRKKEVEPVLQLINNFSRRDDLVCTVGDNVLLFPQKVVDELMLNASEHYDRESHNISCIIGNKELLFPSSLSSNDKKNEKNSVIK